MTAPCSRGWPPPQISVPFSLLMLTPEPAVGFVPWVAPAQGCCSLSPSNPDPRARSGIWVVRALCHPPCATAEPLDPSPIPRGGLGTALGSFPCFGIHRVLWDRPVSPWVPTCVTECPHVCPHVCLGGREPHFPSAGWEWRPGHPRIPLSLVRAGWGHRQLPAVPSLQLAWSHRRQRGSIRLIRPARGDTGWQGCDTR